MIATDNDGLILLWNEGAQRLYSYTSAEIVGDSLSVLHTDEDVRAGLPQSILDQARGIGHWRGTVDRVRKDGSGFVGRVVVTPRREDGRVVGFLQISSEVTEDGRLEVASRARDEFLASVSHELRTPLNAILGYTGTILMELPGTLNGDQRKQLRHVQANGRQLLSLINGLLDVAKIESGKIEVTPESIACGELVEQIVVALGPLADEKGIGFDSIHVSAGAIEVRTDRRALSQILINLTSNAIKFTDDGGVLLAVSAPTPGRTRFEIIDTGSGIGAEDQQKLSTAFTQIDAAAIRPAEGARLGLYVCQRLATLLGATISLESEFGVGSTFRLELPNEMGSRL
jgi:protein-histidine pros-kinase